MKKLLIILIWMSTSLLTIFVGVVFLTNSTTSKAKIQAANFTQDSSLPVLGTFTSENIIAKDARPTIIANFLKRYQSPLTPYDQTAHIFIKVADQYGLDFRLLPAIAMQESNLCRKVPAGSNNCWGHGIYGGKITYYDSPETAMESVAKTLSKYSKNGMASPEEIMRKYTPQSEGEWAASVLHFMAEMR